MQSAETITEAEQSLLLHSVERVSAFDESLLIIGDHSAVLLRETLQPNQHNARWLLRVPQYSAPTHDLMPDNAMARRAVRVDRVDCGKPRDSAPASAATICATVTDDVSGSGTRRLAELTLRGALDSHRLEATVVLELAATLLAGPDEKA